MNAHQIAVILAGGRSQRMGFDKAELEIEGLSLIEIIHSKIRTQCGSVVISGRQGYQTGLQTIPDLPSVPKGPVAAIFTTAMTLEDNVSGFFTVPVDSPNFPDDLCGRLYSESHSTVGTDEKGRHPTFAWWRICDVKAALKTVDQLHSLSLNALADLCQAREISWPGADLFFNINNAHDLRWYVTEIKGL